MILNNAPNNALNNAGQGQKSWAAKFALFALFPPASLGGNNDNQQRGKQRGL